MVLVMQKRCTGIIIIIMIIIQWNLSIAVTIGAKFSGCYRQVAALVR